MQETYVTSDLFKSAWELFKATHQLNYFQPETRHASECSVSENARGTSGIWVEQPKDRWL